MARSRYLTLVRTGEGVESCAAELPRLYALARELFPDGFPAEETRELEPLYAHVPLGLVRELRREVAEKLSLDPGIMPLDRFSIHGCGAVSRHDDKHNYPGVYFIIVVAHSGGLGITDGASRARRHEAGEILLLDPHKPHALLPEGRTPRQHPYERTHSPVHAPEEQFLFLCFDVKRALLRERFRRG
jgi:hypothetical protein